MDCPVDGIGLRTVERRGIEVRWCPACRGVWLERSEVEKLVGDGRPTPNGRPLPTHVDPTAPYERFRNGKLRMGAAAAPSEQLRDVLDI